MTTMMSITTGNSEGSRTRRCDANCYHAHGPNCTCVCGGRNHGASLVMARVFTHAIAKELLEKAGLPVPTDTGLAIGGADGTKHFPVYIFNRRSALPGI